jgi:Domain of Unknown Function (DUF349)
MTTASSPPSALIDNTWSNQDAAQRLVTIEKLDLNESGAEDLLLKIAKEDEHESVRCAAAKQIKSLIALEELRGSDDKVQESAEQQIYRILAGTLDSNHSEAERIAKLQQLPSTGAKQVALITKLKTIGSLAVEAISQNEDLADLCLFAASVHVRKSSALNISDEQLLREVLKKVTGKDKTLTKVISGRLEGESDKLSSADAKTEKQKATSSVPEMPEEEKASQQEKQEADETAVEPDVAFDALEKESSKLSYKNTNRLFEIRSLLRKLLARLNDNEVDLAKKIEILQADIAAKIDKNNEYQEQLRTSTDALLVSLADALEAGNSEIAMQSWDKIQGNISNTANQVRAELLKKSNIHKEKIIELRDWKIFAATEKKKELIAQMQQLIDAKMHAADRSKNISNMHKEWKALGRSSQNEQLWKEFKKASDKAYEPCKEHFKDRKKLMAENLMKRREICESLETEYKQLTEADSEPNIANLNKLLSESEKSWKAYAPIEQSKIKSLQKRYYGTVNQLRKLRKHKVADSAKQKQELVRQAEELATHEDNKLAMNEAKRLQQEWKKIGPTSYREDQKYWSDFRSACDAIFNKRSDSSNELREDLKKIEARLNEILSELDAISKKDDAGFRDSRASYQDLAQEFSNSLDPRIKSQRKRLLDRFNASKRQIDSRFRALPDKRQQQIGQAISEKAALLQNLEEELLKASDAEKFGSLQQGFSQNAWDSIGKIADNDAEKILNARKDAACSAKSTAELTERCEHFAEEFRQLCLRAEIRANIDSPAEDKALRMKLQLEQLKNGFGQAKPDPKQNLKYALNAEFQSLALGPADESARTKLTVRLNEALQKLR